LTKVNLCLIVARVRSRFPFRVLTEAPTGARSVGIGGRESARTRWLAEAEADHGRHDTPAESSGARAGAGAADAKK
jgi:hypothetical protein